MSASAMIPSPAGSAFESGWKTFANGLGKEWSAVTPKEVLALIRQREVTTVDFRFMDFPGVWQHFAIPADALTEDTFEEGIDFDGSSVVGSRGSTRPICWSSRSPKPL